METWLITSGMYDEERSLPVQGMLPSLGAPAREDYHGEHFHRLPYNKMGPVDIVIQETLEAGEEANFRFRGPGQFGVFRKATSDQEDWKLSIYSDNDRETLLAEFTG